MEINKDIIEETLKKNSIGLDDSNTIMEALEKLSVYHEELRFQNDELKRANLMVEKLSQSYESLFRDAPLPYYLLDKNMVIKKANDAGKALLGGGNLLNLPITKFIKSDGQDVIYYLKRKMIKGDNYTVDVELELGGRTINAKFHANLVGEDEGGYCRLTIVDQTMLHKQMEEIAYLSFHDQLTGLYNRYFLMAEMERIDHSRNYPIAMIMADLNGLKLVNDAFGHSVGDQLIRQTGQVLSRNLRGDDILARIGGDEFILVLPKTSELEAKKLIIRMRKSSKDIGVKDLKLSVAYGHSIKKSDGKPLKDILRKAEDRMYKDKMLNRTSQRKDVINSIIATLHEKHPREEAHSRRVAEYSTMVAKALGYNSEELINIKTAALLHDIGKIAIDYSILDKTEKLSKTDYEEAMKHPSIGYRILSSTGVFGDIAEIVLSHHEHVDGTGYPRNLKGPEISQAAKILCVCDAYDAMTSDRSYRLGMPHEAAVEELIRMKDTQFDGEIVDRLINCLKNKDHTLIEESNLS